jgi:hypothetical protein
MVGFKKMEHNFWKFFIQNNRYSTQLSYNASNIALQDGN